MKGIGYSAYKDHRSCKRNRPGDNEFNRVMKSVRISTELCDYRFFISIPEKQEQVPIVGISHRVPDIHC